MRPHLLKLLFLINVQKTHPSLNADKTTFTLYLHYFNFFAFAFILDPSTDACFTYNISWLWNSSAPTAENVYQCKTSHHILHMHLQVGSV